MRTFRGRFVANLFLTSQSPPPSQIELTDQGGRGVICDGNLHVFDVETNKPLAVLKRNSFNFGGDAGGGGGGGGGGGLGWFGGLDEGGDAALGAFGLSTGGLIGAIGGGRGYDMMMTENDPIVAFQTLPLGGGGTVGGGFTESGEETKCGQRMVCVSSDRLHHIDLREVREATRRCDSHGEEQRGVKRRADRDTRTWKHSIRVRFR